MQLLVSKFFFWLILNRHGVTEGSSADEPPKCFYFLNSTCELKRYDRQQRHLWKNEEMNFIRN